MTRSPWWVSLFLAAACGASSGSKSGARDPALSSAASDVSSSGGLVQTSSGASVRVLPGAVDAVTRIALGESAEAAPTAIGALSRVYAFEPSGVVFARPMKVTFPLPPGVTSATVYWSRLDGSGFDAVGGAIRDGKITVETPHFSKAVLAAPVPTRVVSGVAQRTWVSASNRTTEPLDLSGEAIEALVLDGAGNVVATYPAVLGTGAAAGTFTIAGVPTGEYVLHDGSTWLVTSTSAPDLGILAGGKPSRLRTPAPPSTMLDIQMENLAPWAITDKLEFFSTEVDDWDFNSERRVDFLPGTTSGTLPMDLGGLNGTVYLSRWLVRGSEGDHAFVAQLSSASTPSGVPYVAVSRFGALPPVDAMPGAAVQVGVRLSDVSQANALAVDYRGAQWRAALDVDGNPTAIRACAFCGGTLGVTAQAGLADDGFYTSNIDLLMLQDGDGADLITGPMSYGSPEALGVPGTWASLAIVQWWNILRPVLPGTIGMASSIYEGLTWTTSPAALAAAPVTPPVTQPIAATVADRAFYDGGDGVGLRPVVRWSPPRVGTPAHYVLSVSELYANEANRTAARPVATIVTPHTAVTLFPGILEPGKAYLFRVAAVAPTSERAAAQLADAPFRDGIDRAKATIVSGIFRP